MTTQAQIDANRKNACSSTGPRTDAGKHRSSRNALRHGLLAKDVILPDENIDEFIAFRSSVEADLNPTGALQQLRADEIATIAWRLRRSSRLERSVFAYWMAQARADRADHKARCYRQSLFDKVALIKNVARADKARYQESLDEAAAAKSTRDAERLGDAFLRDAGAADALSKVSRHEGALARRLHRALHEFERLQAAGAGQAVPAPAVVDVDVSNPTE